MFCIVVDAGFRNKTKSADDLSKLFVVDVDAGDDPPVEVKVFAPGDFKFPTPVRVGDAVRLGGAHRSVWGGKMELLVNPSKGSSVCLFAGAGALPYYSTPGAPALGDVDAPHLLACRAGSAALLRGGGAVLHWLPPPPRRALRLPAVH